MMSFDSPESSTIAGADYDPETQRLIIRFKSGKSYQFEHMTQAQWDMFDAAVSKGAFFNQQIRPLFSGTQL